MVLLNIIFITFYSAENVFIHPDESCYSVRPHTLLPMSENEDKRSFYQWTLRNRMFQYIPRHYHASFPSSSMYGFSLLEFRSVAMIRRRVVLFQLREKRENEETSGERRGDEDHTG